MTQVLRSLAAIRRAGTLAALLCGSLLATPLLNAQAEAQVAQSAAEELARRSVAEQSARNSGDAGQILASARQFAALALRLLGDLDLAESHSQSSITHYQQSLTFDDAPETRVKLAFADLAAAKPDSALAEYATLTAAQPEDARAAKLAAQAYLQKDDFGYAADALTRAWKLDSAIDTGVLLITADLRAGRYEHADGVAGQILTQTGDGARPHLILAQAFHAAGDLARTIVEFSRVISLEPDSASGHLALGEAFWELNEYQYNADSLHEFMEAQRLSPADFFSNLDLGSILSQYQRYADAMPYLMRAAESDPSSPGPWLDLGMNAYAQNLTAEARPALEKAIALTGSAESRNNFQIRRTYAALSRINAEAGRNTDAQHFAAREQQLHAAMLVHSGSSILSESTSVTANFSGTAGARSGSQTTRMIRNLPRRGRNRSSDINLRTPSPAASTTLEQHSQVVMTMPVPFPTSVRQRPLILRLRSRNAISVSQRSTRAAMPKLSRPSHESSRRIPPMLSHSATLSRHGLHR